MRIESIHDYFPSFQLISLSLNNRLLLDQFMCGQFQRFSRYLLALIYHVLHLFNQFAVIRLLAPKLKLSFEKHTKVVLGACKVSYHKFEGV